MYKEIMVSKDHTTDTIKDIVNEFNKINSRIFIISDNKRVNAKSIMGVLSLSLKSGDNIFIEVIGDDEEETIESMTKLF